MCRKFKTLMAKIVRFLIPQKILSNQTNLFVLKTKKTNVEHIIRSNLVLKIKYNNHYIYFRHCLSWLKKKEYARFLIAYYYDYIFCAKSALSNDRSRIENLLKNKKNLHKFYRMGYWKNAYNPAGAFVLGEKDSSIVGLPSIDDPDFKERIKDFIKFSSVMLDYRKMNEWFGQRPGLNMTFHANIEFAYHEVAKLFGLDYCLPKVQFGFLSIDGQKFFGYFMDETPGQLASSYSKEQRAKIISPSLQKDLNKIFLLDYVCCIYDHAPYNYNVVVGKNGLIQRIFFFDNNEGGGFPIKSSLPKHVSPLIIRNKFNRLFLDKTIASSVLNISKNQIFESLEKYLTKSRIKSCYKRLEKLKKIIREGSSKNQFIAISDDEWNTGTINKELQGKTGRTYLFLFLGLKK